MDDEDARFAELFQRFLQRMTEAGWDRQASQLRTIIDTHLDADSSALPVIAQGFPQFEHVNVQVALTAFLERTGTTHETLGLSGQARHFGSFADLLEMGRQSGVRVGQVDLVDLPVGPTETLACVQFGLFLIRRADRHLVVLMRGPEEHTGRSGVSLEILAPEREMGQEFLADIRRLMVELNVFRGQVVSFGDSPMGHMAIGPVVFHQRPALARDQLVLPTGVLEGIEREVLGIGEHKDRLRRSQQHVKRGVLLHGPPGTGKTHTVRYLVSRATDVTVILLTGGGLHMVRHACALARMLQPAFVVLEDIDLVAQDRGFMGHMGMGNPLLFDVLNEMDGMAEDADVAFVLTTNRADLLEPALAARPGRVDLAVEIPLPDEDERRRLVELYGRGLDLELSDLDTVVRRTSGVTAAFIKELLRKAALFAVDRSDGPGPITVQDEHVGAALDELLAERGVLTRILLGGTAPEEHAGRSGREWLEAE